jgi:hypothetical protein
MRAMDKDTLLRSARDADASLASLLDALSEAASPAQLFEAGHVAWMDCRVLAGTVEGDSFGHYPGQHPHLA